MCEIQTKIFLGDSKEVLKIIDEYITDNTILKL